MCSARARAGLCAGCRGPAGQPVASPRRSKAEDSRRAPAASAGAMATPQPVAAAGVFARRPSSLIAKGGDSDAPRAAPATTPAASGGDSPPAAAAAAEDPADAFACNICLELARDPVVTLCGHLHCWPCLYRRARRERRGVADGARAHRSVCSCASARGWTALAGHVMVTQPLHGPPLLPSCPEGGGLGRAVCVGARASWRSGWRHAIAKAAGRLPCTSNRGPLASRARARARRWMRSSDAKECPVCKSELSEERVRAPPPHSCARGPEADTRGRRATARRGKRAETRQPPADAQIYARARAPSRPNSKRVRG